MTSKIKLRLGEIEVEYEGSEEFLKQEIPALLKGILELHKESVAADTPALRGKGGAPSGGGALGGSGTAYSVTTIATKLGVSSGPELIVAAAASLTFGKGTESFDRKTLLAEMKLAKAYYKASFSDNMSSYLKTLLTNSKLLEGATGMYSLPSEALAELPAKLK